MKLSNKQVTEILEDARPRIVETLIEDVRSALTYSIRDTISSDIHKAVKEWAAENIIPEIIASLDDNKDGLVALAPAMAKGCVEAMSKAMVATLEKKLTDSWERKKLFSAMFAD